MEFHDIVGAVGVALVIGMYFMLQSGRIAASRPIFSILNALGSALILVSLAYAFNLAAALVEVFWLGISLYGLVRTMRAAKASTES